MTLSRAHRAACSPSVTGLALLFVYAPLALVVLNSFNTSRTFALAAAGLHHRVVAGGLAQSQGARDAVWVSVQVAVVATADRAGARHAWPRWRCSGSGSSAATPSRC